MVDELINLKSTFYSEYFESYEKKNIFLLSEKMAKIAWEKEIDNNSTSYFDLPDNCWVIMNEYNNIGTWIESYNNDNIVVQKLLRKEVDWSDETIIQFFAKNKIVFQTKWLYFLRFWDDFIAIEDDCPIIIPKSTKGTLKKEAIVFRPIGDILIISTDKHGKV